MSLHVEGSTIDQLRRGLVGSTTSPEEALGRCCGYLYAGFSLDDLSPAARAMLDATIRRCVHCGIWIETKDAWYLTGSGDHCDACAIDAGIEGKD